MTTCERCMRPLATDEMCVTHPSDCGCNGCLGITHCWSEYGTQCEPMTPDAIRADERAKVEVEIVAWVNTRDWSIDTEEDGEVIGFSGDENDLAGAICAAIARGDYRKGGA